MRLKSDTLLESLLTHYQSLITMLESFRETADEDDDSSEETPLLNLSEDRLTDAMVKAIRLTRSPYRTFGTNG